MAKCWTYRYTDVKKTYRGQRSHRRRGKTRKENSTINNVLGGPRENTGLIGNMEGESQGPFLGRNKTKTRGTRNGLPWETVGGGLFVVVGLGGGGGWWFGSEGRQKIHVVLYQRIRKDTGRGKMRQ